MDGLSNINDLLLLIICSPSGAGKTTLTRKLLESMHELTFSVSHTTREPRRGEVDGQDYHFVDTRAFEQLRNMNHFAESATVHDNLYGTSIGELQRAQQDGKSGIVFDVDYQGARQIKARLPQAISVFILPPSMPELLQRLQGRATDTPDVIDRRFSKAKREIEHYMFFDYLIVNDDVERAAAKLRGIVLAEQSKRERLAHIAEALLLN